VLGKKSATIVEGQVLLLLIKLLGCLLVEAEEIRYQVEGVMKSKF